MLIILNVFFKQKHIISIMPKGVKRITARNKHTIKTQTESASATSAKRPKISVYSNLSRTLRTMHPNAKIDVLSSPVKSASDKKEYKVIRLENGLIACLISDTSNLEVLANNALTVDDSESESDASLFSSDESEKSVNEAEVDDELVDERMPRSKSNYETEEKLAAASLCIGVGSFSDPESIPGLAHFLEHMVFMGSEKYEQENDFDSFLKKRGGSDNASTDVETTTFYFECLEKHLAKALDKFAQFFISPLMKRDAMTREREAIESEFQMAIPSDAYRKEQLLASFARAGTPVNKFLWGNLVTLRDNVKEDVLYDGVHEFRKRHYSAHRMTLAIQARLPLNCLEAYVVNCFSSVPNNSLPAHDFKRFDDSIFNNPTFNKMYYIKPVKDVCQVDLTWSMPSLLHMYKSKPHQYISWLLGHEGKGSLLSYLREKLWALVIYTGNGETGLEHNSMYALFTVTLVLTPEGLFHIYEVIEAVFSYLSLLQKVGPQERIYNEIKAIEDTSFRFQEEEIAVDFVENLAESMQYYPPQDYLTGGDLYFEYNPKGISMVLNKLNPKNLNIMILSTQVPDTITFDKTEPWFSTSYAEKDIPQEWIEKWSKIVPFSCFSLPEDNQFLTTNFSLLDLSNELIPTYPEKIVNSHLVELWYKADNKFKLPTAYMYYYLISPIIQVSAMNACMLDLFINLLGLQLTEKVYPAHVAELGYGVSAGDYGIIVKVDGYNEKLPLLLELLISYIRNVPFATKEDLFNALKDKQAKNYYNTFLKPSKLARSVRLSMLMNTYWPPLEKLHAIADVTFDDFIKFSINLLKTLHIQGLIQGNISKEIALTANDMVVTILQCEAVPLEKIPQIRVTQIPVGKQCCRVSSFNKEDSNSIVTNYYQYGPGDIKSMSMIEVLMLMMEEPLFDILRTKEQLGYNVYCSVCDTFGILGYSITVNSQAKKTTTEHVEKRIEAFVKHISKSIRKQSDKKINQIKSDLIKVKKLVDVHLKDEVSRNWTEIVQQEFMFDRLTKEIASIEDLKTSEIRKWLEMYSLDENHTRKLCIQVVGHMKPQGKVDKTKDNRDITEDNIKENFKIHFENNHDKNSDYTFITDTEKFKEDLLLFPVHKIIS